jgi:predicted DNA-binding protein YlxM (UPF0122 family)
MKRLDLPEEELRRMYWDEGMNQSQIAEVFLCSTALIIRRMKEYNIPRRTTSEILTTIKISKDELYDLYWNHEMSTIDIADMFDCSQRSIARIMSEHDIPCRTLSEATIKIKIPKDELYDLYWNRETKLSDIADIFGCDRSCVGRVMQRYGIKSRGSGAHSNKVKISKDELYDLYWNHEMSTNMVADMLGCSGRTVLRNMHEYDISIRGTSVDMPQNELSELYLDEELSVYEIADRFGCTTRTVLDNLIKAGIDRRPGGPGSGEKNHSWRGGISFEPYCPKFNEAFKESIREKFDRVCFLCPTTEEENSRKLSVHHVNYNKDCLCDDSECEFVPLCTSCHQKTNFNRDYWEETIMEKLEVMECT